MKTVMSLCVGGHAYLLCLRSLPHVRKLNILLHSIELGRKNQEPFM